MIICGNCKKEIKNDDYVQNHGLVICYSCFQNNHYKDENSGYRRWQQIKNNMTIFVLWVSIDNNEGKIFQEIEIESYFNNNFKNEKNNPLILSNRNFFILEDKIEIDAFNKLTGKKLKKIEGEPGNYFGSDGSNFYIVTKEEIENLKKHE